MQLINSASQECQICCAEIGDDRPAVIKFRYELPDDATGFYACRNHYCKYSVDAQTEYEQRQDRFCVFVPTARREP